MSRFEKTSLYVAAVLTACAVPGCTAGTTAHDDSEGPSETAPALASDQEPVNARGGAGDESGPAAGAGSEASSAATAGAPERVPAEVVIRWKTSASPATKARARGNAKAAFGENVVEGIEVAKIPTDAGEDAVLQALASDPDVELAEPNFVYHPSATPDYLANGSLWGMTAAPGAAATTAWATAGARGWDCSVAVGSDPNVREPLYVAVIDEGIMTSHPDLAANMDASLNYDFTVDPPRSYKSQNDPHGTHVAGTIGADGTDGSGVIGLCGSGIRMFSAKFLTPKRGGTLANAIKAVTYVTDLKSGTNASGLNPRGVKKKIIASNNSWGGGGYSSMLKRAIDDAGAHGVLFIAAAGNDGRDIDASPSYPASYPSANIISVAAIDSAGTLASWSNWGRSAVDLSAPGVSILSTVPVKSKGKTIGGYARYSGTSMATPHVTGAAVLYAARHPSATAEEIKSAVLTAAPAHLAATDPKMPSGKRLDVSTF